MNFDNAANAMWVGNESFDSAHTIGAKAVIELYHSEKRDIWDWKDLHMGPAGKHCGKTDMPQGAALAGEPFVNAHYSRQLQGWMMAMAATGQRYNAPELSLSFSPLPSLAAPNSRLPWFAGNAVGLMILGGASGELDMVHKLTISLGKLPAGLEVAVAVQGKTCKVVLKRSASVGDEVMIARDA